VENISMKPVRYLTFEVNSNCNLASIHPRCPVNDPERYMFGDTSKVLTDQDIIDFWFWCRYSYGFEGVVLWHLYSEPTLSIDRIRGLMKTMHTMYPTQRFHLWTNNVRDFAGFEHVQLTDYRIVRPNDLDNRRESTRGEGDYARVGESGRCIRGTYGWEIIIDNHGNWLLCCNDWRCEENAGNILATDDWQSILHRYVEMTRDISWTDKASFEALPRMCRSCITVNPLLHRSAIPVQVQS
jgi:hypothetical protein